MILRYGGEIIKQIVIRLDDDLHKQLKILMAENETSIQRIVEDFLKEYAKKHQGKK